MGKISLTPDMTSEIIEINDKGGGRPKTLGWHKAQKASNACTSYKHLGGHSNYSSVPNKRATRLLVFGEFFQPTHPY